MRFDNLSRFDSLHKRTAKSILHSDQAAIICNNNLYFIQSGNAIADKSRSCKTDVFCENKLRDVAIRKVIGLCRYRG